MGSVDPASPATPAIPYGRRLIASRIDELAHLEPNGVWISIPSARPVEGFRDVTWAEGANAINRAAWWLESKLGYGSDQAPIAYMGPQDIRYIILLVAAIKTKHKASTIIYTLHFKNLYCKDTDILPHCQMFFPSPRNGVHDQVYLLDELSCTIFLHPSTLTPSDFLGGRQIKSFAIPDLDQWLEPTAVPEYHYKFEYEEVAMETSVILHTSSSTGRPKPISCPQSVWGQCDGEHLIPPLDGRNTAWSGIVEDNCGRIFCPMPFFHIAGIAYTLACPAYLGITTVIAPAGRIPNAQLVDEILDHGKIDVAVFPPSLLEDMCGSQDSLNRLWNLSAIIFGGGPLAPDVGRLLSTRVKMQNWLGSTENGTPVMHVTDREDWQYFCLNPTYNGIEWRPVSDENVYEMVFVRNPDISDFQNVFKTFDHLQEFSTKDLFERHPVKPHHWRHVGRIDDVLVFSNGEKLMPRNTEELLAAHPALRSALVVGHGRFNAAAILEPVQFPESDHDSKRLLDEVWRTLIESKETAPSHGRLSRSYLMVALPEKPFQYTAKGTLRRSATLELYGEEIDELYRRAGIGTAESSMEINTENATMLIGSLQTAIESTANLRMSPDDDFFSAGMNSLQVLGLVETLKSSLPQISSATKPQAIDTRLIYANPTLNLLTGVIQKLLGQAFQRVQANEHSEEAIFKDLVRKYTAELPFTAVQKSISSSEQLTILLTGSHGSLGSYVLDQLLKNTNVSKVYCLNRTGNGLARQTSLNTARGLATNWEKVQFVSANLSEPFLGTQAEIYWEMAHSVNCVIHNQWKVDFNLSLRSFEPLIRGVRYLAEFAAQTPSRAPLIFISSVATVQYCPSELGPFIPEGRLNNFNFCTLGYGQSKLAAHEILEYAAQHWGVRSAVLRVGQIAGPVSHGELGMWNKNEWFPSLIASSKYLQMLPDSLDLVSPGINYMPVDYCARIVCELSEQVVAADTNSRQRQGLVNYYHVVNPHDASWPSLIGCIQEHFGANLQIVPFAIWIEALDRSSMEGDSNRSIDRNPALRLLQWFEGMAHDQLSSGVSTKLSTQMATKLSQGMRNLRPVSEEWMDLWLRQWKF